MSPTACEPRFPTSCAPPLDQKPFSMRSLPKTFFFSSAPNELNFARASRSFPASPRLCALTSTSAFGSRPIGWPVIDVHVRAALPRGLGGLERQLSDDVAPG